MQLCDLEDLYNKFKVIKTLRIGSTVKPRFNYSDGYSVPSSDGDILYEKSKFELNEEIATENATAAAEPVAESGDAKRSSTHPSTNMTRSTSGTKINRDSHAQTSDVSGEESAVSSPAAEVATPPVDITSEEFEGPLTKCLEEEDSLILDENFVPNNETLRVKVFLPNKRPLFLIMKRDATVQDTIEKTIRKSNALSAIFQKKYEEQKQELLKAKGEETPAAASSAAAQPLPHSPPLEQEPGNQEIDSFSEFLGSSSREEEDRDAANEQLFSAIRTDLIPGHDAMTLINDCMAYELRMEMEDGEYDMDFPALERGGILSNFFSDEPQAFCLVSVPDYQPRVVTPTSMQDTVETHVFFEDQAFTFLMPGTATCRQLLNKVKRELYPGRVYELVVAQEDKERLKMMSEVVNDSTRLCDIDITQFRVRIKHFHDGPKVIPCPTYTYNPDNTYDNDVDLTSFMFTNFEAGKYKQWDVWLVTSNNKFRKRQFAIDRDEIFVDPINSCNWLWCWDDYRVGIYISDIFAIIPENNPPDGFILKYRDEDEEEENGGDQSGMELRFKTMSVSDCCEIVNRIEHLMRNSH